jgi:hypothetical protein
LCFSFVVHNYRDPTQAYLRLIGKPPLCGQPEGPPSFQGGGTVEPPDAVATDHSFIESHTGVAEVAKATCSLSDVLHSGILVGNIDA